MDYRLNIGGTVFSVSVDHDGEDCFSARIDGRTYRVASVQAGADTLVISVDGCQVRAGVAPTDSGKWIGINGGSYTVYDEDTAGQKISRRKKGGQVPDAVTPPMPAVVVRILVSVGDAVTAGQAVAVVSAMKMETTLKAPFDGVVTGVHAAPGDKVAPGHILVDIEKAAENQVAE
ncbi:biotin/lipoyl-containing protein [Desulfosudis oleivorans]|uniref:Biotin/lipoyl attachment domain-containing protein n=1 Tax=Desulfosudis oleivorans (strain DSM 6200 / JCM 39069 / Hxd3) TaxID=96561 RepID=A8ZUF0_DESOH|nr:biotin/lipoyl-containing protein [Desulfosudis oleivorans]ABW67982.1 biotin/lipoyl attachment domain-containing protein [Desulfosudis oleivorans Hxd3]